MHQQSKKVVVVPYHVAVLMTDADEAIARNDRAVAEKLINQIYSLLDDETAEA